MTGRASPRTYGECVSGHLLYAGNQAGTRASPCILALLSPTVVEDVELIDDVVVLA